MRWLPLVVALAACSQSITRRDAGQDAGEDPDAGGDRDAGTSERDAGRREDAGPVETFGGRLVLSEVQGFVEVSPGVPLEVRALAPIAEFNRSSAPRTPDFSGTGCPLCCTASHFDAATDPPIPSQDAGTVTITGYSGGTFADATTAPSTITCALEGLTYACRYAGGPSTLDAAFLTTTDPLRTSDAITFTVAGMGEYGSLTHSLLPASTVDVTEDLGALAIDPATDLSIHYACGGGMCGLNAIVLSMSATQSGVESPTSFGSLTCAVLGGTTMTVPRAAIAAMLGCDDTGAGCDASLDQLRTAVVRTGLPMSATDSNGNNIAPIVVGQGEFGTSTL